MRELAAENARLRDLVDRLSQRLKTADVDTSDVASTTAMPENAERDRARQQTRASRIAAEKCGGGVIGRFASVRINP
jgi:putative transposase